MSVIKVTSWYMKNNRASMYHLKLVTVTPF